MFDWAEEALDKIINSGTSTLNYVVDSGKSTINRVVQTGKDSINSVVKAGEDSVNSIVEAGEDSINSVVKAGEDSVNSVVEAGEDSVNSVVEAGTGVLNDTINTAKKEISDTAKAALDLAMKEATALALLTLGPAIKEVVKFGASRASSSPDGAVLASSADDFPLVTSEKSHMDVKCDFSIGPFSIEVDHIETKVETLIGFIDKPPSTRSQYKECFKILAIKSCKVEVHVQAAMVIVSSKSVGLGCSVEVEGDFKDSKCLDGLDPIFEALGIH